jgi:hypothetical protein
MKITGAIERDNLHMTSAAEFQARVEKASDNFGKFDGIINGGEDTLIQTDAGLVPSMLALVKRVLEYGKPGPKGDPGAADSVVDTLSQLKAARISDTTRIWQGVPFLWKTDAAPYTSDETSPYVTTVMSNYQSLSVGAWVRQGADTVAAHRSRNIDAITGIIRNAQTEFNEAVKFTQFALPGQPVGVGNKAWDTQAFMRAAIYALANGRSVAIPDNDIPFKFGKLVSRETSGRIPTPRGRSRFNIVGTGQVEFVENGFLFDCEPGRKFYDLVIAGTLRFVSVAGSGSKFINGDAFIRLFMTAGLQLTYFDWGIYATDYLQSVRMTGVIHRGGNQAAVKAPMIYDCRFTHNIIEFCNDGIMIDGSNAPACHTCNIDDNVIEGMAGCGIVVGSCLSTSISGNYMEDNRGGKIFLNASSAAHLGIEVKRNGLAQSADRLAAGAYSIVWGPSLATPTVTTANYSTGHLHDLTGASSIITTIDDVVAAGKNVTRPGVGREISTDGFSLVTRWFNRSVWLDPYLQEIAFYDQYAAGGTPLVQTHGVNSPGNRPDLFDRKSWAPGSIVWNVKAAAPGDAIGWIYTASGAWPVLGVMP